MRNPTGLGPWALLLSTVLVACGEDSTSSSGGAAGDGGIATGGSSGASGSGGVAGTGGTVNVGGAAGVGGVSGTGGGSGTGGSSAGGTAGTGGTTAPLDECQPPDPAWVFCSGFEEGNKDIWDDYDGNPDETNLLLADPGPRSLSGNHVMQFRVPPGRNGVDLVKVLPSKHDRLYARWYIKYEAGFDFSAPNHGGGLFAGDRNFLGQSDNRPDGDDFFTGWVEHVMDPPRYNIYSYYRGMYMDCADPQGSCWGDHFPCMVDEGQTYCTNPSHRETVTPPTLVEDRWYCVEMLMDGGTPSSTGSEADGELDFWVDSVQIGPWNDLWFRTTPDLKLSILWLSLFHHEDHSVAGVMYDNVIVSTERIGCLPE